MTKWEIGQDLIAIADYISEKETEMRENNQTEIADELKVVRLWVGDLFEKNNDHDFTIPSTKSP